MERLTKIRVFLTEDEEIDRMAFERLVKNNDLPYDYTITATVSESREKLSSEHFDVAILDYLLADGQNIVLRLECKNLWQTSRYCPLLTNVNDQELEMPPGLIRKTTPFLVEAYNQLRAA